MLRHKQGSKLSITKYKPFIGTEIMAYKLPATNPDLLILDSWGMAANIQKMDNGDMGISLHHLHTGRMMHALTDADAAKAFASHYRAEAARMAREGGRSHTR